MWVDIEGYEGLYKINDAGEVINVKTGATKAYKLNIGYKTVQLWKENKGINHYIHRLLAKAFIPNPENKDCVDHIDGNRLNNDLSNLRWATKQENARNTGKPKNNTSGYKGVSFNKHSGKYTIKIHVGGFDSAEEASALYEEIASKIFGAFHKKIIFE